MLQKKKPQWNPFLIVGLLVVILMIWTFFTSSPAMEATMRYSQVRSYFENLQVTGFDLNLNTGVIKMSLKEGKIPLPEVEEEKEGGFGLLPSKEPAKEKLPGGAKVQVTYKLPYQSYFLQFQMEDYIQAYNEANPGAPMDDNMIPYKESFPWADTMMYVLMLGSVGMMFFFLMRGGQAAA